MEALNTPQRLDEKTTFKEDLDTVIKTLKTENPSESWKSIVIEQPIDKIEYLRLKGTLNYNF